MGRVSNLKKIFPFFSRFGGIIGRQIFNKIYKENLFILTQCIRYKSGGIFPATKYTLIKQDEREKISAKTWIFLGREYFSTNLVNEFSE